jgi:hypothetical protein
MVIPQADASDAAFPAGPRYSELLGSDPQIAWIRYKVWTADWYTETLGDLGTRFGGYDRQVGIEMAIDGALSSLCGAFDASIALLATVAEKSLNTPKANRTKPHNYDWNRFKQQIHGTTVEDLSGMGDMIDEVDAALEGKKGDIPTGWLAVLQRLRNRATHQTSLLRTWTVDQHTGSHTVVGLTSIPDLDPFSYLKISCNCVSDLTEQMVRRANAIDYIGAYTQLRRARW